MRYADIQYHLGLYGDSRSPTALILSLSCCDILLPGALAAADPFIGTGVHGACLWLSGPWRKALSFCFFAVDRKTACQGNRQPRGWFCPRPILMLRRLWAGAKQALSNMPLSLNLAQDRGGPKWEKLESVYCLYCIEFWRSDVDDLIWSNLICRSLFLPGHGSEAVAALDKKGFRRVLLYGCSIFGKAESWLFCLSFLESPKLKAELFIDLWFITHNSYDFYHFLSFSVVQLIKEERKRCHESLESAQLAFPLYGRTKAWVEQLLSSARPNNMLTMYGTTSSRDILWSLMMYWYLTGLAAFFSSTESLNVA